MNDFLSSSYIFALLAILFYSKSLCELLPVVIQVLLLSRLHHRNLVRLEGFCDESGMQVEFNPSLNHP